MKNIYWWIFLFIICILTKCTDCVEVSEYLKDDGEILKNKKSSVGLSENKFYVFFNPQKHDSFLDAIISAFHECRHLQQEKRYGREICQKWADFVKRNPLLNYQYAATELDARRYAGSFGTKKDWSIFEQMNLLILDSPDVCIRRIAAKLEKALEIPQDQ